MLCDGRTPKATKKLALFSALQHELTNPCSISLTARCLHNGTYDRARCLDLALTDLANNIGLLRKGCIHGFKQSTVIRDDLKAASGNDLTRAALTIKHPGQNLTGKLVVQLAVLNQFL